MARYPKRMRWLAATVLTGAALSAGAGTAAAAPGDPDPSFDGDGKLTFTLGGKATFINDMALQPDGKIVLAGWVEQGGGEFDFLLARLNPNGSFDQGFGAGGIATAAFPGKGVTAATGSAVALQPDGKIVVVGTVSPTGGASGDAIGVARFDGSGVLDPAFNPAGLPDHPTEVGRTLFQFNASANDVAVDRNGKILVAGSWDGGGFFIGRDAFVLRATSTGAGDGSFNGGSPIFHIDFGGADGASRVALQADGKILLAGWTDKDVAVARVVPGAVLDEEFASGGKRTYGFGTGANDAGTDVAIEPSGKIDVAGYGSVANNMLVTRLTSAGVLENSLNGHNTVDADFGGNDAANAIALQANGKIVLAGADDHNFALVRFQPGGLPDTSFGAGGKRTVAFPGADAEAFSVALQPDGAIVLAGHDGLTAAVARLQGDSAAAGGAPNSQGGGGGTGGGPNSRVSNCAGKRATIVGTAGNDTLKGTRRADVIVGLGGNDKISGLAGNDIVCGGAGNDIISGGKGNDRVAGDAGRDKVSGDAGNDQVSGGAGNDQVSGGAGNDNLLGGPGKDKLNGGAGKDKDSGGSGKDTCVGKDSKASC